MLGESKEHKHNIGGMSRRKQGGIQKTEVENKGRKKPKETAASFTFLFKIRAECTKQ